MFQTIIKLATMSMKWKMIKKMASSSIQIKMMIQMKNIRTPLHNQEMVLILPRRKLRAASIGNEKNKLNNRARVIWLVAQYSDFRRLTISNYY